MKFYAQLNENNICIGISQLSGEINQSNMVEIPSLDTSYMWKKYDSTAKTWSTETYEPQTTAPLSEFQQLQSDQAATNQSIAELTIMMSTLLTPTTT